MHLHGGVEEIKWLRKIFAFLASQYYKTTQGFKIVRSYQCADDLFNNSIVLELHTVSRECVHFVSDVPTDVHS